MGICSETVKICSDFPGRKVHVGRGDCWHKSSMATGVQPIAAPQLHCDMSFPCAKQKRGGKG